MADKTLKKKPVAVFDIDGTLFRSSLLIELVNVFIEKGFFDERVRKEYETLHKAWLDRKGDYEDYILAVVKAFEGHIKGIHYKDFMNCNDIVYERSKDKLYKYTRDLVQDLKKKGYFLLAISQSPKGTLDKFCKNIGFDKTYGRGYEIGSMDRFTGEVMDEHIISNKANILKRALKKGDITLEGSIGVGDTEGDIQMLEMVEKPICFNPNERLHKYAKRMGWGVVVERKDVVYEL